MDLYGSKKALSELSQLYVQMNSQEVEEGYKEIDKKKETAMYRRAGNLARTSLSSKGKEKETAQKKSANIVSAITRQKENERFERIGKDPKHQNNYKESLDPVGQEDADVDNDGKKNTKSDKYLMKRRKAIGKAIGTRKEEVEITEIHGQAHKPHEVPGTNLKGLVKKAVKRIDTDVDGDTDKNDKAKGELGEFIPGVGNKRLYSTTGTKTAKESFSNWRSDLREVIDTDEQDKQIKEKKVKNKIVIDPDLKLEDIAHELGAEIVEVIELGEESYMDYAKRKAAEKKDTRMTVTAADKKGNTPAYQNYKAGDKRYKAAAGVDEEFEIDEALTGERYKKVMKKPGGTAYSRKVSADPAKRATRGGKGGESDFGAGDRGAGNKAARRAGTYQQEEYVDEATAMAKRGYDEAPIRQKIAKSTGGGQAADRATKLADKSTFGDAKKAKQRQDLARKQRGDFRKTTSSSPGLHGYGHKSDDPKVKAKQAARGAQRGALTPAEKKQLNREEFEQIDEKAMSRAQQRFMGMVYAAKKGETPASPEVAKAASGMSKKAAKDFAGTKHKGLPEKKVSKEEFEQLDELNRAEKETGINTKTGRPTSKGGMKDDKAFTHVKKMMRKMEGTPSGQRKKEPGKKPPAAGEYGAPRSPAQKVAMRRAAKKRSDEMQSSRFD